MQIEFNNIGCYRSTANQSFWSKKSTFNIEVGVEAPRLRDHLIPDTLNTVKQLEPQDALDLTCRQGERFISDGGGEKMETILQFIEQMDSKETNLKQRIGCEIVCNRGLLVKIAMGKNTRFRAVRRKDVIFMCGESRNFSGYDWNAHMSMKFEKLMADDPFYMAETDNLRIARSGIRTKVVNTLKFPEVTVFSSAEVDCRDQNGDIVELKMTKLSREEHMEKRATHWNFKAFFQSYLSNTKHILTGYLKKNDENYVIDELEMVHRDSLIGDFRDVEGSIKHIADTLSELKSLLSENNMAIMVTGFSCYGLKYQYIGAETCEFVPREFCRKFKTTSEDEMDA